MRKLSALLSLALLASTSQAHYHMLLPDKPSAKKGEEVTVTCQFGHPFESELSDMLAPQRVLLYIPDEGEVNVTKKLEKVSLKGVKGKVDGYRLKFTPNRRGDYRMELISAPTLLPGEKVTVQDIVKVVVHVQAQKGWDTRSYQDFGCAPITRPYGLLPHALFQVSYMQKVEKLQQGGVVKIPKPADNLLVEVERYNPTPPKALPADEFITRTMKTDLNGVVTTNLPEAGWWCLTATRPATEKATIDGKEVEVKRRATFWVHVDNSAPTKPAE